MKREEIMNEYEEDPLIDNIKEEDDPNMINKNFKVETILNKQEMERIEDENEPNTNPSEFREGFDRLEMKIEANNQKLEEKFASLQKMIVSQQLLISSQQRGIDRIAQMITANQRKRKIEEEEKQKTEENKNCRRRNIYVVQQLRGAANRLRNLLNLVGEIIIDGDTTLENDNIENEENL